MTEDEVEIHKKYGDESDKFETAWTSWREAGRGRGL